MEKTLKGELASEAEWIPRKIQRKKKIRIIDKGRTISGFPIFVTPLKIKKFTPCPRFMWESSPDKDKTKEEEKIDTLQSIVHSHLKIQLGNNLGLLLFFHFLIPMIFAVDFVHAGGAKAVAEKGGGVLLKIIFQPIPIPLV
ncbi:MAG: hypothetical protein MI749_22205, partial [Desulfovibrionales bacterium]|nr:hypothetical protein [Desulfovibrionales bacterium]